MCVEWYSLFVCSLCGYFFPSLRILGFTFCLVLSFFSALFCCCCFFFFKQKTAYEMRISDWSSDVCSSDLYDHVHQLQAGYAATPLSGWSKPQAAAEAQADPSIDRKTPPVEQVAQMAPGAFFALFAETLKRNPPHATDYAVLLRMERVGLVPGQSFDLAAADPDRQSVV